MALSREGLVAKLNATCRDGLEEAARLCYSRTHYEVDLEHYLMRLTEASDSDVAAIYRHFEIDSARVSRDLTRALDRMRSGKLTKSRHITANYSIIVRDLEYRIGRVQRDADSFGVLANSAADKRDSRTVCDHQLPGVEADLGRVTPQRSSFNLREQRRGRSWFREEAGARRGR